MGGYLPGGGVPASTSTLSAGKSSEPTEAAIWEAISGDESGGSPWFLSWGLLIRVFLLLFWRGGEKASYCFVIWVWLGWLSEYPVKGEVGYACFSHCNVTRDVWTSSAIFKRKFPNWLSADKSKHNFSLNWGCFWCIRQCAGVVFIRGSGFELNIDVKRPRNKPWRAIYSTCNSWFWLAFCWVPLNPNLAARVQFMFFFLIHASYFTVNPPNSPVYSCHVCFFNYHLCFTAMFSSCFILIW